MEIQTATCEQDVVDLYIMQAHVVLSLQRYIHRCLTQPYCPLTQ